MKKIFVCFTMFCIGFVSCQKTKQKKDVQQKVVQNVIVENVNPQDFKSIIAKENVVTLDVRTPKEVAQANIEGNSNINFFDPKFKDKVNLIDKSKVIAVYCRSGSRSARAAQVLKDNGFKKVYNLAGGMIAWQRANLPISTGTLGKDEHIKSMTLDEFKKILSSKKPVLVEFHTEWCLPCRKMAPIVDEIEKEFKGKAVVLRIDLDKSTEIAKKLKLTGVPVFRVYKNGKNTWKHNGVISKEELIKQLK